MNPSHLRPKRSLGQNFLRDPNIARKIVAAVNPQPGDAMVEIGPGEGMLTKYLVALLRRLVVVEVDDRAVEQLRSEYPGDKLRVIHQDILQVDLEALAAEHPGGKLRILGNIPYNITSPILFRILDNRGSVQDATLMMQREVARRVVGTPGTKDYGILSVLTQIFANVAVLFDVSPNAFFPQPKVVSSVVRFNILPSPRYAVVDEPFFRAMVRSVFGKRRKTLRNSLQYFLDDVGGTLPRHLDLTRGQEQLAIEELVDLSNQLAACR